MGRREPPDPGTYGLADDPPPRRRYRPMPGVRPSSERTPEEPVLRRFLGLDPFPWVLAICVLVWVGLGLAARHEPLMGWVLVAAGLMVCVLSQVWLYISIYETDQGSFFWSLISGWYRLIYLYMNPELAWRPTVLALVGILMAFTGIALFLNNA